MSLLLLYRNANYGKAGTRTLGLGVNCLHTLSVLKRLGIPADATAVWTAPDVDAAIEKHAPDHAIIEAPWLSMEAVLALCAKYPKTHIYIRCHSDLAFLQVEPGAVNLLRETMLYSETVLNLGLMGNSLAFTTFMEEAYHGRCLYLPNLYNYARVAIKRVVVPTTVLKAGSFGAIRLQKNHITGAAAALLLARRLGIPLEFHLISDGTSGGRAEVVQAISNLFSGLSWAKLVVSDWTSWPLFRRLVATMDLAFHLSTTETFSLSTADCLAEGVPVVGSECIEWLPPTWRANLDDPSAAANVGLGLIHNSSAAGTGQAALLRVCEANEAVWTAMFKVAAA